MKKKEKHNYSIKLVVALPGVGKTSTAQLLTVQSLRQGIPVWSNMPIAGAYKIDMHEIGNYDFITRDKDGNLRRGGLLIIDEAGIAVNSRNWQSIPKALVDFLKLHRHFKMDIYFFSQGDDVDMTIKRLAQKWYKLVKCRIPFIGRRYAIAIPVIPKLVLENGQWVIRYMPSKMPFARKYLPIYKTWHLFNSYDVPYLPEKQWEKWGEVYEKDNIIVKKFTIFKRIIRIKLRKFYNRNIKKRFNDIFRSDK